MSTTDVREDDMSVVVVVTALPLPECREQVVADGTLSTGLEAQVLAPHPAGSAQKGTLRLGRTPPRAIG